MRRLLWLVTALSLTLAVSPAIAEQGSLPRYRQIASSDSKFQQELNAAAAEGYRVIAGDATNQFALLEHVADGPKHSYVFTSTLERFLESKKLEPGYRLVRPLFATAEIWTMAVFERVGDDDRRYEYKIVKAGSPKDLRKKMEQEQDPAFGLVALSVRKDAIAVYEAGAPTKKSTLIFGNAADLKKQFSSDTYCVIDSDGTKEAVYAVHPCPATEAASGYEVLASTKTDKLEADLNAAAARGLALVASSLIGIAPTSALMLGSAYKFETVCLVARVGDPPASRRYRVLGTRRAGTLAKEMAAAADDGFTLAGFAIGYQEIVAVMHK